MLCNRFGHRFFVVLEYTMKTVYQGRGTPHWHFADWIVCFGHISLLAGRTKKVISAFVRFLELVFRCDIDVQVGNGRLNYINGYVYEDHDAVDVGLGEYVRKRSHRPMACGVSAPLQGQPLYTRGCHPYGKNARVRTLLLACPLVSTSAKTDGGT